MHVLFEDREEGGRRIAARLESFRNSDTVIVAIPRGGVPVASAAAQVLGLDWNVIVTRKLPVPTNPEAGFGAVTADGATVLNRGMLAGLKLDKEQVERIVRDVRGEVIRRTEVFSEARSPVDVSGRPVIVLDDGLASGYTMLAAIKSLRSRRPSSIVAAAPVASKSAAIMVGGAADECVFEIVSAAMPFAVADFYVVWHDLTDDDILPILREGRPIRR